MYRQVKSLSLPTSRFLGSQVTNYFKFNQLINFYSCKTHCSRLVKMVKKSIWHNRQGLSIIMSKVYQGSTEWNRMKVTSLTIGNSDPNVPWQSHFRMVTEYVLLPGAVIWCLLHCSALWSVLMSMTCFIVFVCTFM